MTLELATRQREDETEMKVSIGDKIRFSTALLKDIDAEPDHQTVLVSVKEIRVASDGSKILFMETVAPAPLDVETP
jgi:hypothetical protein